MTIKQCLKIPELATAGRFTHGPGGSSGVFIYGGGEMRKELQMYRDTIIVERDVTGSKKFFRVIPDGRALEIEVWTEQLVDELDKLLFPLDELKDILGQEENPGPIFHLLTDMLDTLTLKMNTICEMIEEEYGRIDVYECADIVNGVTKGALLCVKGPSCPGKTC